MTQTAAMKLPKCSNNIFKLSATLAVQMQPPNFDNAVDAYGELINRNPQDYDSVSASFVVVNCVM